MTSIKLTVTGAEVWASVTGILTSGMVGIPVTIQYDASWDGLRKNLVCRCSPWNSDRGDYRTILDVGETATVAHEVMQPDMFLYLGVEGYSSDGKLVMPTRWAECGKIQRGANSGTDISADPTLPVWQQLQTEIEEIKDNVFLEEQLAEIQASVQAAAEAAASAERSKKSATAASTLAVSSADEAEGSADSARVSMESAKTSASTAAYLANETLRLQRAAEAAAERAEIAAGVSENQKKAVVLIHTVLSGCDLSNPVMLHASGAPYEATIKARDHHIMGSVYVEVGGVDVTKDVYDPETDTIHISAPTADVYIEAFCPERQSDKTVDLVLFSGQSNMSGRGDGAIATVCPEGEGYWYKDGSLTQITGYFGNESNSTGSMVSSIAKAYFDSCSVPIVAVSNSYGGTPISQFVPAGGRYTQNVTLVNEAAAYLETQGYTVRKKAMVWCQGETDAENGMTQADYATAFRSIRDGLKTDCGITEFFLVEIGQHKTDGAMLDEIKAAQEHLTDSEPDIIMASRKFVGATGLMKDTWHYTQAAYNLVGRDTGIHMAYYHTTGIRPRTAEFSAADVSDQDTPVVNDELDATEWSYKLYEDKALVGLNQYIGSAEDVTVKAQYKVGGITYSTALDRSNKTGKWVGIFEGNTAVKSVTFEDGIVWMNNGNASVNSAEAMFKGCTALETVVNIPPMLEGGSTSNRSADAMYYGCKALVSAEIPLNAVNARQAFAGCNALTEYAEIPSTVTDAWAMFQGAALVHCPDIPATVTGCTQMFAAVNKATSAGVICANTASIRSLFYQQELLAGTVRIESAGITDMTSAFAPAAIPNITFEVSAGSTTYATLVAAYPTANVTTF